MAFYLLKYVFYTHTLELVNFKIKEIFLNLIVKFKVVDMSASAVLWMFYVELFQYDNIFKYFNEIFKAYACCHFILVVVIT